MLHGRQNEKKIRDFPNTGNVRAKEAAIYLGIALSTYWLWVKQGKLPKPLKLSSRTSVWKSEQIRDIAENGFKEAV